MSRELQDAATLAVTHVGILTSDIEDTAQVWERLFALTRREKRPTWFAREEGVLATYLPVGAHAVEPLQPLTVGSLQATKLALGRRAFHLSIRVRSIQQVAARIRSRGTWVQLRAPGQIVQVHRGWIDDRAARGVVFELIDEDEVAAFRSGAAAGVTDDTETTFLTEFLAVGHVVSEMGESVRFYEDVLGFAGEQMEGHDVFAPSAICARMTLSDGPAVEVVQPVGAESVVGEWLVEHGEGIAYLKFAVSDLPALEEHLCAEEAWLQTERTRDGELAAIWVRDSSTHGVPVLLVPEASTALKGRNQR